MVNVSKIFLFFFISYNIFPISSLAQTYENQSIVNKVYHKLQKTVGDFSVQYPTIFFDEGHPRGAYYNGKEIAINKEIVELCKSYGSQTEDALSFIIGHELAHFYLNHDAAGLGCIFLDTPKEKWEIRKEKERQADIYGSFITTQANYKTTELAPDLLEKLYALQKWNPAGDTDYPSLQERKELSDASCKVSEKLTKIYKLANNLLALEKHEEAYMLYDTVITNIIHFKELHNNMGLSSLIASLVFMPEKKLTYPFTIDLNIPNLRAPRRKNKDELIQQAIDHFLKVERLKPDYTLAKLHLLIAYHWQGNQPKVREFITSLTKSLKSKDDKARFNIIQGNIAFENGNDSNARRYFNKVKGSDSSIQLKTMAQNNLAFMNEGGEIEPISGQKEKYPAQNPEDNIKQKKLWKIKWDSISIDTLAYGFYLQEKQLGKVNSFLLKMDDYPDFRLQIVKESNIKTKKGIGIGSSIQDIYNTYKDDNDVITRFNSVNGIFIVSRLRGLIFYCDKKGFVTEWGRFM